MKTMKYLSIAALALMGIVMTSCSSNEDDNFIDTPQQPAVTNYSVTKTLTVNLDGGEGTRALTSGGVKTFAVGDQIAVAYQNTSAVQVKAVSEALKAGDISVDGKTASFTVTFTEAPKEYKGNYLYYTYPASITTADGGLDYSVLNTQDGTLATLASKLDCCLAYSGWNGTDNLPALTLDNKFAIGKFVIKNSGGTDITSTITGMTVSDGTYTYSIVRSAAAGPVWVAMQPVWEGSTVNITATDGTNFYTKAVTIASGKDLLMGKIYPINVTMNTSNTVDLSKINVNFSAHNGQTLTGTLGANVKISIADGASVTLNNATINGENDDKYEWAGITCEGNATIILSGANTLKGFYDSYPGVYVPTSKTVTIQGTGSLDASSNGYATGIGGGYEISCGNIAIEGGIITATGGSDAAGIGSRDGSCGTITISGGTVTATAESGSHSAAIGAGNGGTCGNITINGGIVTATGDGYGAAIGSGRFGTCNDITITNDVTSVTAIKGGDATYSIGAGNGGTCGTVTVGGNTGAISTSPYTFTPAP